MRLSNNYKSKKKDFLNLVDKIRHYMPDCSLSTDVIVGFPGETDEEFMETLDVIKKVSFNSAFMFKYSSRPGTKAAEYSDQIKEEVKQSRLESLIKLQKARTLIENQKLIGSIQKVIVEKESKKSAHQWAGRTMGNTWVIFDKANESIKDIVEVLITDARGITLFGQREN